MWPIFWLNLVLAALVIGVLVWTVRRFERRTAALESLTAALREELLTSIRAQLSRPPGPSPDEWTSAKNARRIALIDREVDEVITPEEARELELLQEEMRRYVNRVAPLPMEAADRLYKQLLEKAVKVGNT